MQQAYADFNAAVHAAFAILAALYHRKRTGKGQYVDMAQLETLISTMGEAMMEYTMNGEVLGTQGNQHPTMAPHGNYPCRGEDKWVSIAVNTEEEWKGFCEAMGNPPWTFQEKFADKYKRLQNRSELDSLVSQWTLNHTHYEVTDLLQRAGAAAAPLLDTEERFFDPHFQKRRVYLEVEHPATGMDWVAGIPWKLSETPGEIRCPSPLLGQHNRYVFGELLGMSEEEISRIH